MIKELLHKTFSVLLATIVLFSTMSFTIEKHFCGGELVAFSLIDDLEKCDMGVTKTQDVVAENSCCNDVVDVIVGQDNLSINSDVVLTAPQQFFLSNYFLSLATVFDELTADEIIYASYSPPNLIEDIQILDQVFMI